MLASLDAHREASVDCAPTHFIYFCIPEHVERVAGLATWDRHGPRFRITTDGTVVRDGNFDTALPSLPLLTPLLNDFRAWQKMFGRARKARAADLDLLVAIIAQAERMTRERYPESRFDVLLWDGSDNDRILKIESGLKAAGVTVLRETNAIPDLRTNYINYVISEHDLHPNARQNDLLADYITQSILGARSGIRKETNIE
jgi:hypothetical protein